MSALIPSSLRSSPAPISPATWTVSDLAAAAGGFSTVGISAASSTAISSVEINGVRSVSPALAPAAVAITRVTRSGGRIYGVPCSGVGAAATGTTKRVQASADANAIYTTNPVYPVAEGATVTASMFSSALAGADNIFYFRPVVVTPPDGKGATATVSGKCDDMLLLNGVVKKTTYGGPFPAFSTYVGSTGIEVAARNRWPLYPSDHVGYDVSFEFPPSPDWRLAVSALAWVETGLPWRGAIWSSALSGLWVRRISWAEAARSIRYISGAGTTRAIAVRETGEVCTPDDFGAAEWLAEDWEIAGSDVEPQAVDVTDWRFSGPSWAVPFACGSASAEVDPSIPPNPIPDASVPTIPSTGRGFVYSDAGRTILVPAETVEGAEWRP